MQDSFGRTITYLRLSVTDLCSLRCRYCMPETGVREKAKAALLTEGELLSAVRAAASLGVTKVRITGGEPLLRPEILSICRGVSAVPGIRETAVTTNGLLLPELAAGLKEAGVRRVNLSLDTLRPEKYRRITRTGTFADAWKGFQAALDVGFERLRINAVLLKNFSEEEIPALAALTRNYPVDVRFIELMPMPGTAEAAQRFLSAETVPELLPGLLPGRITEGAESRLIPAGQRPEKTECGDVLLPGVCVRKNAAEDAEQGDMLPTGRKKCMTEETECGNALRSGRPEREGVAELWHLPGAHGNIGLIRPVSRSFCGDCDRIRLTADGKLRPCLHSPLEFDLKGKTEAEMREVFRAAVRNKPAAHGDFYGVPGNRTGRQMNEIGG